VPAPQAAIAVGRDIRDDVCRRRGHSPGDELSGQSRERAGSALLPAPYEGAGGIGVDDCRTGRCEGEPPPGALAATIDRPGSVSAAAGAERRVNWHQPDAAAVAEEQAGLSAGDATRGNEELEEPRRPD
jgi:hypothetical protein